MLEGVEAYEPVNLTPVERLLMATDGTVTHMLEALTRGPVDVDIIDRSVHGGSLIRKVVLRRRHDDSALTWAQSEVNLYPLDEDMESALVEGDIGIGDLLRDTYSETRREVVEMDAIWAGDQQFPAFIDNGSVLYLKRTYHVYSDENRIMEITEYFPKGIF